MTERATVSPPNPESKIPMGASTDESTGAAGNGGTTSKPRRRRRAMHRVVAYVTLVVVRPEFWRCRDSEWSAGGG
jgi:hypothetical protein